MLLSEEERNALSEPAKPEQFDTAEEMKLETAQIQEAQRKRDGQKALVHARRPKSSNQTVTIKSERSKSLKSRRYLKISGWTIYLNDERENS